MEIRSRRIQVRISPEVKKDLEEYASSVGFTVSGLASFIIGQWVRQQNQIIKPFASDLAKNLMELAVSMEQDEEK